MSSSRSSDLFGTDEDDGSLSLDLDSVEETPKKKTAVAPPPPPAPSPNCEGKIRELEKAREERKGTIIKSTLSVAKRSENANGVNVEFLPKGLMTNMVNMLRVSTPAKINNIREAGRAILLSDPSDKSSVLNRPIGTRDGMTCLQFAIASGVDSAVLAMCLGWGGDPNKLDKYGRNALHHLAIASGRIKDDAMLKLIQLIHRVFVEVAPDGQLMEVLGSVADPAGQAAVKYVCNRGKIYQEMPTDYNAQDAFMCTPLHYAAEKGNSQLLHYLIVNCKAKLRVLDSRLRFAHEIAKNESVKKTILNEILGQKGDFRHFLKMKFHEATVEDKNQSTFSKCVLDELDAYRTTGKRSIDEVTPNGHTALHFAAARNSIPCAQYFIKHNANPHIRDNYGQLPIDLAASHEIGTLIQEAMNNTPAKP